MPDQTLFQELLAKARQGDCEAILRLFQAYEKHLQRAIRLQLAHTDGNVRTKFASSDIAQSVFRRFFVEFMSGNYQTGLESPDEVLTLLRAIARNRVKTLGKTKCIIKQNNDLSRLAQAAADTDTPSQVAIVQEIWRTIKDRLTPAEVRIVEMRLAKHSWDEIGCELNTTGEAARKRICGKVRNALKDMDPKQDPDV